MIILDEIKKTKKASYDLALLGDNQRNEVLSVLSEALLDASGEILAANVKDLASIDKHDPLYDRLLLNENRIKSIANWKIRC